MSPVPSEPNAKLPETRLQTPEVLRLPASVAKVELLGAAGVWRPLAFRRGANGYAAFDVALPCYGVAVFKVR